MDDIGLRKCETIIFVKNHGFDVRFLVRARLDEGLRKGDWELIECRDGVVGET